MATAVGQSVEIPIILHSLADSMAVLPENELPLAIHPDFLATLDMRRTTNAKSSRDMILAGGLAGSQGIWIQSRSWINYLSPAALHITVSNGHLKH